MWSFDKQHDDIWLFIGYCCCLIFCDTQVNFSLSTSLALVTSFNVFCQISMTVLITHALTERRVKMALIVTPATAQRDLPEHIVKRVCNCKRNHLSSPFTIRINHSMLISLQTSMTVWTTHVPMVPHASTESIVTRATAQWDLLECIVKQVRLKLWSSVLPFFSSSWLSKSTSAEIAAAD